MRVNLFRVVVFAAMTLFTIGSTAQSPSALFVESLANDDGEVWTEETVGGRLGTDDGCTQGIEWVFYSEGRLLKRSCVEGSFSTTEHTWSVIPSDIEPVTLTIDSESYWLELLTDKIAEPGLPPLEVLIAKIQQVRQDQEQKVVVYELRRNQ